MRSWLHLIVSLSIAIFLTKKFTSTNDGRTDQLRSLKEYIDHVLPITVPVTLEFGDTGFAFPDLVKATQIQVDSHLKSIGQERYEVVLLDNLYVDPLRNSSITAVDHNSTSNDYAVEMVHASENFVVIDSNKLKAFNFYSSAAIHENDIPYFVAQCILYHLLRTDLSLLQRPNATVYSPQLHVNLVSVFLNGDDYIDIPTEEYKREVLHDFLKEVSYYCSVKVQCHTLNSTENSITDDLRQFESKDTLNLIYSHVSNKYRLSNLLPSHDISYFDFREPVVTRQDLWPFLYHVRNAIASYLELPAFPRDNIRMKLWAMKKHNTIKFLSETVTTLQQFDRSCNTSSMSRKKYQSEVEEIVGTIASFNNNKTQPNWDILFQRSWTVLTNAQHVSAECSVVQ
ncbi:hypothetical protein PGUG_05579 [Meyerozyma guilliermondii ATCC 6260]|uniref:Uncharacterized protein n=1 Tax=Meyerozyma guilliermondii (strain ATCC 6260 / CBS 566 / DSM 6381 / JCM 1539 / NBRC 10279 / NRRL Y-324) TaxID=294746 RepID=A5DQM8_PICGU|nr:uncharacterized protein PGUG_05579 [Meyerozyma guilliermondii ATCC 6260]EDK41481.2 hypothetical protein PGUG_05579 [Meyerozyma guilliermondii ATCC 6260]